MNCVNKATQLTAPTLVLIKTCSHQTPDTCQLPSLIISSGATNTFIFSFHLCVCVVCECMCVCCSQRDRQAHEHEIHQTSSNSPCNLWLSDTCQAETKQTVLCHWQQPLIRMNCVCCLASATDLPHAAAAAAATTKISAPTDICRLMVLKVCRCLHHHCTHTHSWPSSGFACLLWTCKAATSTTSPPPYIRSIWQGVLTAVLHAKCQTISHWSHFHVRGCEDAEVCPTKISHYRQEPLVKTTEDISLMSLCYPFWPHWESFEVLHWVDRGRAILHRSDSVCWSINHQQPRHSSTI